MSAPRPAELPLPDLVPVRRALLSVSDKTGLVAFAQALARHGCEIISTGGTAEALKKAGLRVVTIESVTGFPEMMDGRVKTLHPKVHGGLLALRDHPAHAAAMKEHGIGAIDLVCVNLYPFEQTVARADCTRAMAIENIDIGGPSMIRSGAKNHAYVTVVTGPGQYGRVEAELSQHKGSTSLALREALAGEAFSATARYDGAITAYMTNRRDTHFSPLLNVSLVKVDDLRYGENPHQRAALYRLSSRRVGNAGPSLTTAEQLHGKELSYNNINDGAAALELALALLRVEPQQAGACVIKHTNPCGCALAPDVTGAVDMAIAGDPIAAYGGIIAINRTVDAKAAERLVHKDNFFEVVIAPAYSAEALALLRARWANVRLLALHQSQRDDASTLPDAVPDAQDHLEFRSIPGGVLVQDRDLTLCGAEKLERRAGPRPTAEQVRAARFLEATGRFLFSNAIVLGGSVAGHAGVRMFGAGAGQMDRVTSCRLAVEKAGPLARGAVAFSDAFFPFADGPEILIKAGVQAIVHPGGSKRDEETFALCEKHGVTCLVTGLRHFRH
ncbi:MAG: bifunctional phosphoribosylaminoimidazolecarboxamide formyltransferase/IMP cyclohydrolase [Phycisphaerales bacterium]